MARPLTSLALIFAFSFLLAGCGSSGTGDVVTTGGNGGATGGNGGSTGGSGGATGGSSGVGGGSSFACGALATCQPGEYCESVSGGACGGNPPDDAGACAPNCNKSTCGGPEEVCLCTGFSCAALPTGCTSCACVTGGCGNCTEDGKGGIFVHCAAP
ncbi:MAG: hypothetical protein IPI67_05925 [Myxococcales bacterium]|nr:hypothetical protein [Myxococcales bacterium]